MQYNKIVIRIYLIYKKKPPISLPNLIFTPITPSNHCIKYLSITMRANSPLNEPRH